MPTITFKPSGMTLETTAGTLLLDVVKAAGLSVEAPCGGHGVCGKCLVKVEEGAVVFENSGIVPQNLLDSGFVLACRAKVGEGPLTVNVAPKEEKELGKFLKMTEEMHLVDDTLLPSEADISPIVKTITVNVKKPQMGDGFSDYDRLRDAICFGLDAWTSDIREIDLPLDLLQQLPQLLRDTNESLTISYYFKNHVVHVVDIDPTNTIEHYGVAVDIGTTTVAIQLVDMADGVIVAAKTEYNGQIECGLDIISRINYATKPERLAELRKRVLDTINGVIKDLAAQKNIPLQTITNASVAANTTMVHLFMGIVPEYIRLSPYVPGVYGVPFYNARELGLCINPHGPVFIAPGVGSYVGGDITAGMLCNRMCTDSEEIDLFIDIGTNGEIVLGNHDFLMGCACSAGPAFEGGGIKCGMRASMGAIEDVEINEETGEPTIKTIGNKPAAGICGSGIIAILAKLLKTGWLDPAGRFTRTKPCAFLDFSEKNGKYILCPADKAAGKDKPIVITEMDIDNVMRAKAAIFSACRTLLLSIDMDFSDLSRMYVAGGFGRFLDVDNCQTIGLLPKLPKENFFFIGNSSVLGAYMTLLSEKHRDTMMNLAQKITYVDLGTQPGYMDQYTAALFMPHTDASLFQ